MVSVKFIPALLSLIGLSFGTCISYTWTHTIPRTHGQIHGYTYTPITLAYMHTHVPTPTPTSPTHTLAVRPWDPTGRLPTAIWDRGDDRHPRRPRWAVQLPRCCHGQGMLQAEAGCPKDDHHVNRSALVQSTTHSGQVSMRYSMCAQAITRYTVL